MSMATTGAKPLEAFGGSREGQARPSQALLSSRHAPTAVRGPIVLGLATVILLIGGFVTWSLLAPLNSAVMGQGMLMVESYRRDIQHLEGGTVRRILVRDGAEVREGDLLIVLDPTRAAASLQIVTGQIDSNRALLARLRAEMRGAEAIEFDSDLISRAASDRDLGDVLQGQREIFRTRRAALQGQVAVQRQRIAQFQSQITGLEAQEQARLRQMVLIQQELDGVNELLRNGFAPRTRALALSRELARLRGEQGEFISAVARSRLQIGEADLQIIQLEKAFHEDIAGNIQETQNNIREQNERFIANQDIVRHHEIRAPISGTVVGLNVYTEGGIVGAGRTLMQIVPVRDNLIIEVQVSVQDVEVIHEGQDAMIRFPALPQRTLPMLTGRVRHVSADRFTDERTGLGYFKVRVTPDEESLAKIAERRLVPGMPAEVAIATGQRTAARYLIEPLFDAIRRAMRER